YAGSQAGLAVIGFDLRLGFQIQVLRSRIGGAANSDRRSGSTPQCRAERACDILGDVRLDLDGVAGRAVVTLRPAVDAAAPVDQLGVDADGRRRLADAASQDVGDPSL